MELLTFVSSPHISFPALYIIGLPAFWFSFGGVNFALYKLVPVTPPWPQHAIIELSWVRITLPLLTCNYSLNLKLIFLVINVVCFTLILLVFFIKLKHRLYTLSLQLPFFKDTSYLQSNFEFTQFDCRCNLTVDNFFIFKTVEKIACRLESRYKS